MKAKVLGWAHKQGEYNGFKYDNFVLHIVMQRSVQKFTKSHFCTYTFKVGLFSSGLFGVGFI